MLRKFIFVLMVMCCSAPVSKAQDANVSIEDIQRYFNAYSNLFTNTVIDLEALDDFLLTRFTSDAVITASYTDNITKKRRSYSQTADEAVESILITAARMRNMQSKIEFKFLEISDDQKTATVRYLMHYHGAIRTRNSTGRMVEIPYKSIAGCAEWLDITNSQIRLKLADCNIRTNFSSKIKK